MNILQLNTTLKELKVIYAICLVFIVVVSAAFYFNLDALAALPLVFAAIYLCIYRTVFYMLLLCFLIPFSLFFKDIGGGLGLSLPTEPMIWLLFSFFFLHLIMNGKINMKLFKIPIVAFLTLNLVWMVLSAFASSMPLVSLKYTLARFWFVMVFFFFLLKAFENPTIIRKFLTYLLYGTVIVVLITLFKHAKEDFERGWGYDIMKPFFEEHTMYSAYISFFIPIALLFATRGQYFNFNGFYRSLFLGIFIVLCVGIIFSFTRASWLSLIAASVFYIFIKFKISFKTIIFALLFIVSIGFLKQDDILYSLEKNKQGSADDLESHAQSVSNITTDPSNLERVNRWECAILMFKERPIFGFGPGTYTFQYAPFQRPESLTLISTNTGDLGNTHSEYFNALSEMGLIGFISWVGLFLSSIYVALSLIYNQNNENWVKSLATAVLLGLFTYYIHAFLNNFTDFDKIAAPFWGFLSILTILKLKYENIKPNSI